MKNDDDRELYLASIALALFFASLYMVLILTG